MQWYKFYENKALWAKDIHSQENLNMQKLKYKRKYIFIYNSIKDSYESKSHKTFLDSKQLRDIQV